MLGRCAVLVLVLVALVTASDRPRRQYSGSTNVGYRRGSAGRLRSLIPTVKACVNIHKLENGQVACGHSGCRMRCLAGYTFTDESLRGNVMLLCDHSDGKLKMNRQQWLPEMTLCSPSCGTGCRNGGTCDAPDQCTCSWPYTGKTCEDQRMVGDDPNAGYRYDEVTEAPVMNSQLAGGQRRIVCQAGTQMPDGSTDVTLTYRNGRWYYPNGDVLMGADRVTCSKYSQSNKPHVGVPPVANVPASGPLQRRSCEPPCENGGTCGVDNACTCSRGFWGPTCHVRTCTYPRFATKLNASLSGNLRRLRFACHRDHYTSNNRNRVEVFCRQGSWTLKSGSPLVEEDVQCFRAK